ncbi:MAG TPA: glycine--tRNA ligase subunit beta [Bryobacterales bacterium]|nr:glycine--tRNA ligase subunit beta [Bryobacterales bacterium]
MAEFLLEIGTEEIPDWMIEPACEDLERNFLVALEEANLHAGVTCTTHATPRRLVLVAEGIKERQVDKDEVLTGPPKNIAFDEKGNPTKAGLGFAKRTNVEISQIEVGQDSRLFVKTRVLGRPAADILGEMIPGVIEKIHFPKTMYWTSKTGPRFIRPIRWLLALLDGKVVPFEIAGVAAAALTQGHRRLGSANIAVSGWSDYQRKLAENYVLLSAQQRRERIEKLANELVPAGLRVRKNDKLLTTLGYLTEYPTPILGGFETEFLELPEEVLETVMQHHQRYFAIEDQNGKLQPRFIAVANLDGDPDGEIQRGHERVLRARFNDARFFWDVDQKRTLADRVGDLDGVVFHAKLGTYRQKSERTAKIVHQLGANLSLDDSTRQHARRAAELAKCDLTTDMVGEFPELQGVVGGLYAAHQGEAQETADAVYDHYLPVGADDAIPRGLAGRLVAIADKVDTLGGFFGADMMPSGSRDPFALRRAAYGIIRILIEGKVPLSINRLCEVSGAGDKGGDLSKFFVDRLGYYLRDVRGYRYDEVNAVMEASSDVPLDVALRTEAISEVRPTPDFEPLAVSFKRIENILKQAGGVNKYAKQAVDPALLAAGAEADLHAAVANLREQVSSLKQTGEYVAALTAIASLRPAVDRFFDDVLVMAKDPAVKNNRLTFLAHVLTEFSTIADFAEIVSD